MIHSEKCQCKKCEIQRQLNASDPSIFAESYKTETGTNIMTSIEFTNFTWIVNYTWTSFDDIYNQRNAWMPLSVWNQNVEKSG